MSSFYTEIIFDVETKKLFEEVETPDPSLLGVSIICAYKRQINSSGYQEVSGQMLSFWEADFPHFFAMAANVDRLVGFNTKKFDVPALTPYAPYDFSKLNHFDILENVKEILGFRPGLDLLALHTLGTGKNDVGTNAVTYWRQNTPDSLDKLEKYCRQDVKITTDLYHHGLTSGQFKFIDRWNTPRSFTVDFSYHQDKLSTAQASLF